MTDAAFPSEIVIVLGMHRSGTSTVTRSLSLLGYSLPKTLIKGNASNRRGHWESQPIARLNDRYLNAADLTWADWNAGQLSTISAEARRDFEQDIRATIADQFPAGQPAVIKEPRMCRLVTLYRSALGDQIPTTVVITVRNPLEVIASLVKRNGMTEANACLLWLRYMLDAVTDTADMPRAFVAYDDCISNPIDTLRGLGDFAGLTFPNALDAAAPEITEYLSASLRNYASTPEDVLHSDLTRGWVSDVYNALLVLKHDPTAEHALKAIARVKQEFDAAAPMLGYIISDYDKTCKELSRREYALTAAVELKTEQVKQLRIELAETNLQPDHSIAPHSARGSKNPTAKASVRSRLKSFRRKLKAKLRTQP